jgi:hypothetical protein
MRFSCPNCTQLMECPDDLAGAKASCPKCGQKVLIPTPPEPANKTTLGKLEDDESSPGANQPLPPVPPIIRTAVRADSIPSVIPARSPTSFPVVIIIAAVLLLAYGSFVIICGCWDVTYGMKSINDMANQQPAIKAAFDRHAPGLIKIALFHSVCRFLSGFLIVAAGSFLLLRWPFGRVVAFSSILIGLAIELLGRILVVVVMIPVANKIEAERAAQQFFGQPEFGVGTVLMVSQIVGVVLAVGLWAVFCVPVCVLLTTSAANITFGGRFWWNRLL